MTQKNVHQITLESRNGTRKTFHFLTFPDQADLEDVAEQFHTYGSRVISVHFDAEQVDMTLGEMAWVLVGLGDRLVAGNDCFERSIERSISLARAYIPPFSYTLKLEAPGKLNGFCIIFSDKPETHIQLHFEDVKEIQEILESYMSDDLLPEGSQDTPETWKAFSKQLWENQNE